jgi:uncharacterized protein (DUF433 family)
MAAHCKSPDWQSLRSSPLRVATGEPRLAPHIAWILRLIRVTAHFHDPARLRDNHYMDAITRDPEIMHGAPVFRGTRVPVQPLFDYIEGGETLEDFLEGFPTVSRELALQALEEAKHLLLARA